MPLNYLITLVIPILNEAESLPQLLNAIKSQSYLPDEIIFSDAGSTDGSAELIEAWWQREGWETAVCRVLTLPGAMPGAGRNAGVKAAKNDWIAFIDGGVIPDSRWLEELCLHIQASKGLAVFGVCHFSADSAFSKAVCALTYGHGSMHPVVPASLIARQVFYTIGFFPPNLRAGEDLIWVNAFVAKYGARDVCDSARVHYVHFPKSWWGVMQKWRVTELHCVLAGARTLQQFVYVLVFLAMCVLTFFAGLEAFFILLVYFALRGVIDPIRRSVDKPWWGNRPLAPIIAPLLALVMDFAKFSGAVQGLVMKLCRRKVVRSEQHVDC